MNTSLKSLFIILLIFNCLSLSAAEDEEERRRRRGSSFGVHLNLAPMALGNYSLNGEYGFSKNMSGVLSAGFLNFRISTTVSSPFAGTTETGYSHTGFMAAPEFRYYVDPSRRGLDKWFLGGYLKVRSTQTGSNIATTTTVIDPLTGFPTVQEGTYGINYFGVSLGTTFGYILPFKNGLTLGFWSGLGYFVVSDVSYTNDFTTTTEFSDFPALDPRIGVTVGYRF